MLVSLYQTQVAASMDVQLQLPIAGLQQAVEQHRPQQDEQEQPEQGAGPSSQQTRSMNTAAAGPSGKSAVALKSPTASPVRKKQRAGELVHAKQQASTKVERLQTSVLWQLKSLLSCIRKTKWGWVECQHESKGDAARYQLAAASETAVACCLARRTTICSNSRSKSSSSVSKDPLLSFHGIVPVSGQRAGQQFAATAAAAGDSALDYYSRVLHSSGTSHQQAPPPALANSAAGLAPAWLPHIPDLPESSWALKCIRRWGLQPPFDRGFIRTCVRLMNNCDRARGTTRVCLLPFNVCVIGIVPGTHWSML
eukprot:scaffold263873_cov20-Tisochrysis_lutea.AAC.1